ncbi:MAG: nicotinate-nucleotide adenylyltransferase [Thermomicrobiales bacterium]|nr:nicotinate-nucleotide adenylyltransferase [Thermomicrobiales bacterium]
MGVDLATRSRRRLGLFGGTFDPIHTGHLIMASEALAQLELDEVLFLPAGQPPHKPEQTISSDEDRSTMIDLAIAGRPAFSLSAIDLGGEGPSYSADLVERIAENEPESELFFIIGSDSLRDFHTWFQPRRITARATIAVLPRPGATFDLDTVLKRTPSLRGRLQLLSMPLIEISSTDIRKRAAAGMPFWYQVPEEVEAYIAERGLYRPATEETG